MNGAFASSSEEIVIDSKETQIQALLIKNQELESQIEKLKKELEEEKKPFKTKPLSAYRGRQIDF
jgi:hypothetical protein